MYDEERIQYEDIPTTEVDVLLSLPHPELEAYIRETRSIIDNAQLVHDRLRSVRMEKIRRECAARAFKGGANGQ